MSQCTYFLASFMEMLVLTIYPKNNVLQEIALLPLSGHLHTDIYTGLSAR